MIVAVVGAGTSEDPFRPDLPAGVSWSVVADNGDGTWTVEVDARFAMLEVDRYTVPADGATRSVARLRTTVPTYFVVDGIPTLVQPVDDLATLELAADAPGAITVQVQAHTFVIVAEAV